MKSFLLFIQGDLAWKTFVEVSKNLHGVKVSESEVIIVSDINKFLSATSELIRPSVDGLYRDGTVHISREMHKQCFITRPEMTRRAPKPHRHRSRTFL